MLLDQSANQGSNGPQQHDKADPLLVELCDRFFPVRRHDWAPTVRCGCSGHLTMVRSIGIRRASRMATDRTASWITRMKNKVSDGWAARMSFQTSGSSMSASASGIGCIAADFAMTIRLPRDCTFPAIRCRIGRGPPTTLRPLCHKPPRYCPSSASGYYPLRSGTGRADRPDGYALAGDRLRHPWQAQLQPRHAFGDSVERRIRAGGEFARPIQKSKSVIRGRRPRLCPPSRRLKCEAA